LKLDLEQAKTKNNLRRKKYNYHKKEKTLTTKTFMRKKWFLPRTTSVVKRDNVSKRMNVTVKIW